MYDLAFFGSSEFAIPILESLSEHVKLVVTQMPQPAGRNRKITSTAVAKFAVANGLNLIETDNVNDEKFIKTINEAHVRLSMVVAFGQILGKKLLESVQDGFFNVHASLLPLYRGAAPIQRALMDGARETGITIFKIDRGLDTGKIAMAESVKIDPLDNFDVLSHKLSTLGSKMVLDFVNNSDIQLRDQIGESSYAKKISIEETFIKWEMNAENVGNTIRAFDSQTGARTFLNGETVKLFGFAGVSDVQGKAGEISKIDKDAIIFCGERAVVVSKIQFPSKRVMSFAEAKNGRKIDSGFIFGS